MKLTIADGKVLYLKYLGEIGQGADPDGSYASKYTSFVDPAVKYLAESRPIKKVLTINTGDSSIGDAVNGMIPITLPSTVDKVRSVESGMMRVNWQLKNEGVLAIDSQTEFPIDISYNKKPDNIPVNASDSTEFELDADVQILIPLLCAVWASKVDVPDLSNMLQIQFNSMASTILNNSPTYGNIPQTVYMM